MTQVEVSLEIFNNLGQKIFEEKVFNDKIFILKKVKLKNGIYFLKIKDLNNRKSEILKIVKK